jgi:curved DNA-binding protein
MIFKDYYKILGLETNKVSLNEIKIAYKEQAKKYHPDVNGGSKQYEERFKDINEAYNTLSNAISKRKYDRTWNNHIGKKQRNSAYQAKDRKEAIWKMFFGNTFSNNYEPNAKTPVRGENIETEINISLQDAFYGNEKSIGLRTVDGKIKTFKISVPAGIQNNERIRIIGQGKKGTGGAKNGDLFIRVKIDDNEQFKLDGFDLRSDLYLTPWEAALSTKVNVPTIDGELSVYIPSGIQSGEEIKIENKGYKDGKGGRGDLILETKIMIPKHLSDSERTLFKQLKSESRFNPRNIV